MKVIFYTATSYLDTSIEIINVLKNIVDLHVLIEVHPGATNMNIIEIEKLPTDKTLVEPSQLLSKKHYQDLEPYFKGVKSIYFAVHPKKSAAASIKASYNILRHIRRIKPDVLHLEALSIRSFGLAPALFLCKKLVMSIHDPVPHSGEKNLTESLARNFYFKFPIPKHFLFYSKFAKNQFAQHYHYKQSKLGVLQMKSLTYFHKLLKTSKPEAKHILFFGRLSKYKGIDVLLEAMPQVFNEFPNEVLVIAGRPINGYTVNQEVITRYSNNITLINQHISNEDLVQLISESKFIICPYIDATQSGVVMTAFALNTPVIATTVGGFPEVIKNNVNGLLVEANNSSDLSEKINLLLKNDLYLSLRQKISSSNDTDQWNWNINKSSLLEAYNL